ncbi:MAG: DUF3667 domain-containing protein [Flavobacteriaceae bacterium]|nr:DUF3667 domain-containing protein [Flavobacteriaceae bacterium]
MENQLPEIIDDKLPRLTVKEIRNETLLFFNLEKGLLFTFVALMKEPYSTIQTYLHHNRRKFSNPLQYILIGVALYTILISIHPGFTKLMKSSNEMNEKSYAQLEKQFNIKIAEPVERAQGIYFNYQNVFYIFLIPAVGFATFLLFEKPYNYAENLAINAYVFGTTTWFSIFITAFTFFIEHIALMFIMPLISILLMGYLYKKIFQEDWLKTIGITFIVFGILMVLSLIFQFGIAIILMFT